jgi:hypothetical protein
LTINHSIMDQEKKLASLFQQLGKKTTTVDTPDFKLKAAVFSTIDATSVIADVVDLFTLQFVRAQAEVVDTFIDNEEEVIQQQRLLAYFEKARREIHFRTEGEE